MPRFHSRGARCSRHVAQSGQISPTHWLDCISRSHLLKFCFNNSLHVICRNSTTIQRWNKRDGNERLPLNHRTRSHQIICLMELVEGCNFEQVYEVGCIRGRGITKLSKMAIISASGFTHHIYIISTSDWIGRELMNHVKRHQGHVQNDLNASGLRKIKL